LVLTYHSFGPSQDHPYLSRLPVARFEQQLAHLRRHHHLISLGDGIERLARDPGPDDRPMVALTVDDGYGDNYTHMYPVMRRAGVPVTVFLATDYLDTGRLPWPTRLSAMLQFATVPRLDAPVAMRLATAVERLAAGRVLRKVLSGMGHAERDRVLARLEADLRPRPFKPLPPLTWQQVREMSRAGIRFGAHTHFHGWLDRLPTEEVDEELVRSRQRIEAETGEPCTLLAYPNGNWSEAVAAAAERAGFELALTQDRGLNRRDEPPRLALRRLQVPENERIGTFACRVGGIAI
jgi:peptidoglycan/xylan/chitin deacetylase (PgdA/CDA1 family)